MKLATILSVAVLAWSIAVLCKLAAARAKGVPYEFTQWDGGLALRGRVLRKTGALALGVFCAVLAVASGYMLAHVGVS